MRLKLKRKHPIVVLLVALLLIIAMSGCTGNIAAARDEAVVLQDTAQTVTESAETDTVARPEGWSEETHGNEAEPNYDVVFPDDRVNQITITIAPEDWEAMQANMVDLFGEAGSGGDGRGIPGGFEPPEGAPPQPGAEGFPDGFEPPEDWDQAVPPERGPAGGRPS